MTSLYSINELIFVMGECCVFFVVQTEFVKKYLEELQIRRVNVILALEKWSKIYFCLLLIKIQF
jgi:hypothetical protein